MHYKHKKTNTVLQIDTENYPKYLVYKITDFPKWPSNQGFEIIQHIRNHISEYNCKFIQVVRPS